MSPVDSTRAITMVSSFARRKYSSGESVSPYCTAHQAPPPRLPSGGNFTARTIRSASSAVDVRDVDPLHPDLEVAQDHRRVVGGDADDRHQADQIRRAQELGRGRAVQGGVLPPVTPRRGVLSRKAGAYLGKPWLSFHFGMAPRIPSDPKHRMPFHAVNGNAYDCYLFTIQVIAHSDPGLSVRLGPVSGSREAIRSA